MFKGKRRNRDKKDQPKAEGKPPQVPNRKGSSVGSVSQTSSANREPPSPSTGSPSNSKGSKALSGSSSECSKTEDLTASRRTTGTRRGVKFAYVQVREYERIIADNPSCSSGAPIGIGWAHSKDRTMHFDEYERLRPPRREALDLVLTRQDREELLLEWGATFNQIIEAIRSNIKIKNQRRRTVQNLGTYDRWEEAMESASRRIKRTVLMQKPTSKQAEHMMSQIKDDSLQGPTRQGSLSSSEGRSLSHNTGNSIRSVVSTPVSHSTGTTIEEPPDEPRPRAEVQLPPAFLEDLEDNDDRRPPVAEVRLEPLPPAGRMEESYSYDNDQYSVAQSSYGNPNDNFRNNVDASSYGESNDHFGNSVAASSYGDSNDHFGTSVATSGDGFENLQRDDSFWEVQQGVGFPEIRRMTAPVIISEDGIYDLNDIGTGREQGAYGEYNMRGESGFPSMQPPPFSSSMVSRWE